MFLIRVVICGLFLGLAWTALFSHRMGWVDNEEIQTLATLGLEVRWATNSETLLLGCLMHLISCTSARFSGSFWLWALWMLPIFVCQLECAAPLKYSLSLVLRALPETILYVWALGFPVVPTWRHSLLCPSQVHNLIWPIHATTFSLIFCGLVMDVFPNIKVSASWASSCQCPPQPALAHSGIFNGLLYR